MAQVYVDENARFVVIPLRASGHDVLSASDVGRGYSDVWHFRRAISESRTVITLDTGYYFIHGLWTALMTLNVVDEPHSGILTAVPSRQFDDEDWVRAMLPKLNDELTGRMLTWHPEQQLWQEDLRPPWKGII